MWQLRHFGIFVILLALVALTGATYFSHQRESENKMRVDYKIPEGCDFSSIGHKYSSNPCSPQIINPDYIGVLINLPSTVELSDDMEVPLACSFAHDISAPLNLTKPLKNSIVFFAVDKSTNDTYSGTYRDIENRIPRPPKPKGDEDPPTFTGKKIVGGYLNIDIMEVLELPRRDARYYVYATVANYKSNVVDLDIRTTAAY